MIRFEVRKSGFGFGVAVGLLLTASPGCAGRTAAWQGDPADAAPGATESNESKGEGADEAPAITFETGDAAWAERTSAANVRQALALWKADIEKSPDDYETLVKLTRGHYFLADGYLRHDDAEYLAIMDEGVNWGERALIVASPEFAEKMRAKEKFYEAIKVIPKEAVPAAYWYAAALGKWAKKEGFAVLLGQKDNVKATMEACLELDRDYFYAGPDRYFGAFYAIAPGFAGGDLDKSQTHYDESLAKSPGYLGTKVLMAENLMVKNDDQATFEKLLAEVLAADANAIPELKPEMLVEQAKAKELLANIEEYF